MNRGTIRAICAVGLVAVAAGLAGRVEAKVFYSRDEALRAAFPDAETVEKETLLLTEEQARQVEGLSKVKLESRMVTLHVGKRGQKVLGYAIIDIHVVRTQPEAIMTVLSPEGVVDSTMILAFHEALDYLPSGRWVKQFIRRTLVPDLALGQGIAAITGATLSAIGITDSVRRALAVYQVMVVSKKR